MGIYAMTGGATGIGAAIKQRLLSQGHQVLVVDIKAADIIADLSATEGRQEAIDAIRSAAPEGLNGFIACAGLGPMVPSRPTIASVNYFGAVELVEALQPLVAKRRGTMVLISSNSATGDYDQDYINLLLDGRETEARELAESLPGQTVYGGSKQALARWMRRQTAAYARAGVRLNAVAPGYIETPLTAEGEKDPTYGQAMKAFKASIPVGRAGQPDDIADAVSFLCSPEAGFIAGSVLFVDGGHDAMQRSEQF